MLLMEEKDFRGGICYAFHWYVKTNSKYMKDYTKNKELTYLKDLGVNNLYQFVCLIVTIREFQMGLRNISS